MSQIRFERPFSVRMDVVETDDRVPSLRLDVKIDVSQFHHDLSFRGSVWIECAAWSRFVEALAHLPPQGAMLADMNGRSSMSIQRNGEHHRMSWVLKKTDSSGTQTSTIELVARLDQNELVVIKREFEDFPVWW